MVADKGKKLKVGEKVEDENADEQIDEELVLCIEKLQEIQDELEKINEEASDEVLKLEQTYNEIRKPSYDKRNEIIKTIPDFWSTAFMSHPALGTLLTDEDQKIFKYMTSLEVEDFKDVKSGYSISFNFSPNPFFEDTKVTKSFTFLDDGTTKVNSTSIKWKEGMGLANGVSEEKKGNKRVHPGDERTLIEDPLNRHVDAYTYDVLRITEISVVERITPQLKFDIPYGISHVHDFFIWFTENNQKDDIDESQDEIADIIKEDLWPNPLTYFNNEADEVDFEGDERDEEENGSDNEEEDDEEDDDEDEDGEEDDDEDEDGEEGNEDETN